MPTITINKTVCSFDAGMTILQVANAHGIEIPQYCYHDGLSIVASCRICLAEVWAPNPRSGGKLEPYMGGKLLPTCQTTATDGMVVHTDSPKAVQNQKAVMEYLLINHPLDCPVCDQAGECLLQDYSYRYGRSVSRFEETKVKQQKKDLGPHVYLYADRCIMCSRCVRFTREVTGTAELMVDGRGDRTQIDVFPGVALDNELASNVIDLCPVGALLDKDFLFAQRVWFLRSTPSIDGITSSGDNIVIEHNEGRIYRVKPRVNASVNRWWITDEVRYGWPFVHSADRLASPMRRRHGELVACDWLGAYERALDGIGVATERGGRLLLVVSPMLSCEDAAELARAALACDEGAVLALGPVPRQGEDRVYPLGAKECDPNAFVVRAEKAPNARGVRRVLRAIAGTEPLEFDAAVKLLARPGEIGAAMLTGNYPSRWATDEVLAAVRADRDRFVVLIDTLTSPLVELADVVLPSCTWAEKAGTFENATGLLQAFEQAIPPTGSSKADAQIGIDLAAMAEGQALSMPDRPVRVQVDEQAGMVPASVEVRVPQARPYSAASTRRALADRYPSLAALATEVVSPTLPIEQSPDMQVVEL